ncbi:MAG: hypothetical protein ACPL07_00840 [Candidatus Bathyarchaeia archaeon]
MRKAMLERAITLVVGFRRTGKTSLIKVASPNNNVIYVDARKFEHRSIGGRTQRAEKENIITKIGVVLTTTVERVLLLLP